MYSSDCNLILTGFMGTGKTTIGKCVAQKLKRLFVDTDDQVMQLAGKSIPTIFAQEGELSFREYEAKVCQALESSRNLVIATGGGTLLNPQNRARLQRNGIIINLMAHPKVIQSRLAHTQNRPLWNQDWQSLLQQRMPFYQSFSNQLDTSLVLPQEAADQMIRIYQMQTT